MIFRYLVHLFGLLWDENYIYRTFFLGCVLIVIYGVVIVRFIKSEKIHSPILYAVFFFFLITILSIAFSRHSKGVLDVFKLRYSFYTIVCMSVGVYMFLKTSTFKNSFLKVVAVGCILLYINSFVANKKDFYTWKVLNMEQINRYKTTGSGLWPEKYWNEHGDAEICKIMDEVIQKDIYQIP